MSTEAEQKPKICFVIMPISDVDGYEVGHFARVYDYLIGPACIKARFRPTRADEVQRTNHIIIDVVKRVVEADMVLCDLSSRNPNVMYELGIRQAFDKPVTIIKDMRTPRIFDIQGLRDVEYDETLRIDKIEDAISRISGTLINTYNQGDSDVNSVIQLLGITAASISTPLEVSKEGSLLLDAITDLGSRLSRIEDDVKRTRASLKPRNRPQIQQAPSAYNSDTDFTLSMAHALQMPGSKVRHDILGDGTVVSGAPLGYLHVQFADGKTYSFKLGDKSLKIPPPSPQ
ncbi:MAG TPA: hypothetical protein VFA21_22090 [Pyrinomonadaceae bacterium]|jgi:hypothetical protein|nr:hypothetical protein [Pyrinomonadaceae bacterium]